MTLAPATEVEGASFAASPEYDAGITVVPKLRQFPGTANVATPTQLKFGAVPPQAGDKVAWKEDSEQKVEKTAGGKFTVPAGATVPPRPVALTVTVNVVPALSVV